MLDYSIHLPDPLDKEKMPSPSIQSHDIYRCRYADWLLIGTL